MSLLLLGACALLALGTDSTAGLRRVLVLVAVVLIVLLTAMRRQLL